MSSELVQAMELLESEKGISREVIKDALETALVLAYKRNYENAQNVEVEFDVETGTIKVFSVKEVVETNYDPTLEMSLEQARQIHRAYEIGDKIKVEVTPKNFGRIATQTAKHVVMQRIREAERQIIYNEFIDYQDEILTGTVERMDARFVYINLGKVEAVMPVREQIPNEQLDIDQRVKVYVVSVDSSPKGPQIVVSRAHPNFLKRLFEQEVPEIYDGIVEIMAIAREAGDRSKVAVLSRDPNVDPVGTCVGQKGSRVQSIVQELNNENMDIIEYDEDPAIFIKNAMSPAEVLEVVFQEEENSCIVVVPEYQLSLAIGKKGQNARLAARLTQYKIDIKSEEDYQLYVEEQAALNKMAAETIDDDIFEEVLEIEEQSSQELIEQQDINEQNYQPEDVEEAISNVENDGEQDYDELLDEYEQ